MGSDEGFLERRKSEPYRYGPFELPYRGSDNCLGSIKLVQYHDYSKSIDPVNARAWILQESLLAPRLLSYSYQSMAWSCRNTNKSDGGPGGAWYDFKDRALWANLQKNDYSSIHHCIRKWISLVEFYSSRALSLSKDRLPAISALAHKYVKVLRTTPAHYLFPQSSRLYHMARKGPMSASYAAGLWYCKIESQEPSVPIMFLEQLLWSTLHYKTLTLWSNNRLERPHSALFGSTPESRLNSAISTSSTRLDSSPGARLNQTYVAPSWSWASVERPVVYEYSDPSLEFYKDPGFEIMSCEMQLEMSEARYGNVTSGRLTTQGSLLPILDQRIRECWNLVIRPDSEVGASYVSEMMEGKKEGWLLPVTNGCGTLPKSVKDPKWTLAAPKALVVVAEGEYYRRIGLCSMEPPTPGTGRSFRTFDKPWQTYLKRGIVII